ncbi:hypothetical protein L873DRAFT_925892 [Choiromyces venosus 120613-1]|uniref:Uncharacterized protein n=1 Tax=Choiromyces venosus 120613-1 TaxID=1336337 RepID=A0A3N4JQW6_9PEZI|nr:hypothetical protein L873DRAFT_925892 [Choiromyces venosus 120613-1]
MFLYFSAILFILLGCLVAGLIGGLMGKGFVALMDPPACTSNTKDVSREYRATEPDYFQDTDVYERFYTILQKICQPVRTCDN